MNDSSGHQQRILILGATGRAGTGALAACLESDAVAEVRVIVRRALERQHPKLRQIVCSNFEDFSAIGDAFEGIDACLFCLGTSVRNVKSEDEYRRIHVTYALAAARTLLAKSPNAAFIYVSGQSTHRDSRMMWARVKAEAEDALGALGFERQANVRPGGILGEDPRGLERWLLAPLLKVAPAFGIEAQALGRAMLALRMDRSWNGARTVENMELLGLA